LEVWLAWQQLKETLQQVNSSCRLLHSPCLHLMPSALIGFVLIWPSPHGAVPPVGIEGWA